LFDFIWPPKAVLLRPALVWPIGISIAFLAGISLDRYLVSQQPAAIAQIETAPEPAPERTLSLTDERIARAGIEISQLSRGVLSRQIVVQATVAARPDGAAMIGARADGTVTQIRRRLGEVVAKGETLGLIQSRDAARLAEEIASAEARLVRSQRLFDRRQQLLVSSAVSRQDFDAADADLRIARAEVARARAAGAASGLASDGISLMILSPIAGRITAAPASLGAYVVAGDELFRVVDPTKLEIHAAVPAQDARRVSIGDRAILDLPQGTVEVEARAITPDIDLQSRTAKIILAPLGNAHDLQPGRLVTARVQVDHGHSDAETLLISSEAVQKIDGEAVVFVRTATGFRVQPVVIGAESGGMVEILEGLSADDRIASLNSFLLKAEFEKASGGHD
jgi:cobalt-zinc-cadmium efflux system membrane fusion protein